MGRTRVCPAVFCEFSYLLATGAYRPSIRRRSGLRPWPRFSVTSTSREAKLAHAVPVSGVVAGAALKHTVGHRAFTHSILVLGLLTPDVHLLWPSLTPRTVAAGALGFASHLVLDALTQKGVEVLWPLPWGMSLTRWLPMREHLFRTHGFLEVLVFRPLLLAGIGRDVVRLLHVLHVKLI